MNRTHRMIALAGALALSAGQAMAQHSPPSPEDIARMMPGGGAKPGGDEKPDFPPFDEVVKDYDKVVSTADGSSLYTLYKRDKDGSVLAELPRTFEKQNLYVATAISGGIPAAGIQFGEEFLRWKRYDKTLALIEPNLETRSTGDAESRASRDNQYTDTVVAEVPIKCMGPGGGPVIDITDLLVGQSKVFFGNNTRGANTRLLEVTKCKAFPENLVLSYTFPAASGQFMEISYSWSVLPENTGYSPRESDYRVGFFTTAFTDLKKVGEDTTKTRYANRWNLQKAAPELKMSPPKQPIVFYIEHTTPVKYRRYVREAALEWNKAFEKVGLVNAVEVYQQDAESGAHMDKDPEDVRYNFLRWQTNNLGFAIGPSRVDPRTGQILDADVLMNDGWLRFAISQYQNVLPQTAMETFGPETLAWIDDHPNWDPRIRLASPNDRDDVMNQLRLQRASRGINSYSGHELGAADATLMGDQPIDGLVGAASQKNGFCMQPLERGMDLAMVRLNMLDLSAMDNSDTDDFDGVPEEFVGAIVKDVLMHEVGHVLGLRHNFKASTAYTIEQINSPEWAGRAITGSVMDYNAMNYHFDLGKDQGPYVMPTIGPYDYWAIEYGYTFDKDLKPILDRVSEPELAYATDEDTFGPDPTARRRDMGSNVIDFVEEEMRMIHDLRTKILERSVDDGDSWTKARQAYQILLGQHLRDVSTAANWLGGTYINRDRKGDTGDRDPVIPVEPALQRRALAFVITNSFNDDAYGLTPELLSKMTVDKWWDEGFQAIFADPAWDVHDSILGIQASVLTQLLNPTTLRHVYDNEFRSTEADALTLPEVLDAVADAAFTELDNPVRDRFTAREPMISSLRQNLQRETIERLIDLTMPGSFSGAASKPIATLSAQKLRQLQGRIDATLKKADSKIDPYTVAHLTDATLRIGKALDANYIYNANEIGGGGPVTIIMGDTARD
ncbi:MAG: zinc-dependent metalloprotease [Phycisphaeraceae bacterium]|nr:zinc-dependent metalloprotease [Phycisphaeraceae bacterium]